MDVPLEFIRPPLDWHALAPEITLLAVGTLLTLVDIIWDDKSKQAMPTLAGVGLLATLIPILAPWDERKTKATLWYNILASG